MTLTLDSGSATYAVRRFRSDDRDDFLSLYERVFGRERTADWFRWKYVDNPFVEHVPIVVAEHEGSVVGCRSLFALEMAVDGDRTTALQPCDTMVHPDHRRQGLFTRMNERTVERYADRPAAFFFNFPNERSKRGNEKLGWRPIGAVPMYYRPQNPFGTAVRVADGASSDDRAPFASADGAVAPLDDVVAAAHRLCDRALADADVRVERHGTPPAAALEAIYRRSIPDGIHAARTRRFYRWRLENPARTYVTYLARRGDEPVAALIVSPVDEHLRIIDALPRTVDDRRGELERLLVAALSEFSDRTFVTAFGRVLPRPLRFRFYPDTRFPLSSVVRPTTRTLFARNANGPLDVEGSEPSDWTLSRLDLDTT